jgi:pimeloyl-ACP methyl ester carboxylesterase
MICSCSAISLLVVSSKTATKAPPDRALTVSEDLRQATWTSRNILRRKGKAMPSRHAPTSEPVATFSDSKKLGSTTVPDRLGNVRQQHADAKAHSRHIVGASRNARYRAVGRMTAGTRNLRPVRDTTPSLEFRTINGHRCAFRIAGSGPAIVLIHGLGANSSAWNAVQARLAHRFTVIAPDLLGHGESDKPRNDSSIAAYANGLRDLVSVLNIDHATVVGHSLGGGIAMQFTYQFPEFVERLVLVGTGGVTRDVSIALRLASLPLVGEALAGCTGGAAACRAGSPADCGFDRLWPRPAQRAEVAGRHFRTGGLRGVFPHRTFVDRLARTNDLHAGSRLSG